MAIVKIKTAKRNIKCIINYVTNPEKTNELLISGKDCTPETASIEMQVVKEQYNKLKSSISLSLSKCSYYLSLHIDYEIAEIDFL